MVAPVSKTGGPRFESWIPRLAVRVRCEHVFVARWRPSHPESYAYLLGMYLGDGCLSSAPRTFQLVIACDAGYPGIIARCVEAVERTGLPRAVHAYDVSASRCVRVVAASPRWPEAFPQHGPGRKHDRPIVLEPWQRAIVDTHPEAFLLGLLHSDGCRTVNRFRTRLPSGRVAEYAYPRWFFSNRSADILGLFCESCDRLGIRWTRSNPRNISVAHRDSVARLDTFVPAKESCGRRDSNPQDLPATRT